MASYNSNIQRVTMCYGGFNISGRSLIVLILEAHIEYSFNIRWKNINTISDVFDWYVDYLIRSEYLKVMWNA